MSGQKGFRVPRKMLGWNGRKWVDLGEPTNREQVIAIAEKAHRDGYQRVVIMKVPVKPC